MLQAQEQGGDCPGYLAQSQLLLQAGHDGTEIGGQLGEGNGDREAESEQDGLHQ